MTIEAWLFALGLTLPVAALALLTGWRGHHAPHYWTLALGLIALPLALAPVFPWLVESVPVVLKPITPMLVATQELSVVGADAGVDAPSVIDWPVLVFAVWSIGALARTGLEIRRSLQLSQTTSQAQAAGPELEERVRALGEAMGVNPAGVCVYGGPTMVTGLIHPRLYLNVEAEASPALDQIVRHELAHMRRRDVLALSCARLLGIALWFNPFVFAVEARRRLAAELDCDRLALSGQTVGGARLYARALLQAVGSNSGSSAAVGFGVAPRKAIEMRLTSILSSSPEPRPMRSLARVLVLGMAVALLGGVQAAQAGGYLIEPEFTEVIVEGRDTSAFGPRVIEGVAGRFHRGHDIAAPIGTPIKAPADGRVIYVGDAYMGYPAWGHTVQLDHGGGWTTLYAHLDGSTVSEGDLVRAGDVFATVGNSGQSLGPHLHVEVAHNGEFLNPADHLPGLAPPAN